ncbi:hypothetical protein C8R43DRAFT_992185 [Mycena crocata]|nr:hypothetical protein C8R43DRAFT_992185 [Mycena crocata]
MDATTPLTKTLTKSSRSLSTGPIIVNLGSDTEHQLDDIPPPSPRLRLMARPLRRKKHLSIYRASAPAQSPVAEAIEIPSAPRPQSMISQSSAVVNDPSPLRSETKPMMHNRSHSQPNIVRLGHPSRPYYSAIRKNMSRPNSPLGNASMTPSRSTSTIIPALISSLNQPSPASFGYLPHVFDDTDDDDAPSSPATSRRPSSSRFSFGFGGFSTPASALNSGFSVSGEMEMRMALAALAREAQEQGPSLQFQETGKTHDSVGGRVRKLGKGLKDLVRRRHGYTRQ